MKVLRLLANPIFYAYCFALLVGLTSCTNSGSVDGQGNPETLLVGLYGGDNPAQTKEAQEPFRLYLEKSLGMHVKYFFTSDYTAVIQALRAKKIHMAELTPFAYVLATQKPGLTPLVTLGIDGKPSLYHSIIFTNPRTGIRNIAALKANAKKLSLCFADPASTSGHLIPRAFLNSIGLNPDNAFREVLFAGSHAASILSVKSGKVDIGCSTSDLALNKLIREGTVKAEDLLVLWTSPPIVNDAITIRSDLDKRLINKVRNAYLTAAKDDYPAFKAFAILHYPHPERMAFLPVQDSAYNNLREIAGKTKDLQLSKP